MSAFPFAQYGRVLATRDKGRRAAADLRFFADSHSGLIEASFLGCEVATPPFMQEVCVVARELGDRLIWSNLNEDIHDTLTFVENKHLSATAAFPTPSSSPEGQRDE